MNLKKHNLIYIARRDTDKIESHMNIYNRFENAFYKVYDYAMRNRLSGYDPYDGLNSKFTSLISGNSKWLRLSIIHFNKNFPINLRGILRIKKGINLKGTALFASAFLKLYELTKDPKSLEHACFCLDFLKAKTLKESYTNHCWVGVYFKYQSVEDIVTPKIPSIICTVKCASAFLEHYRITGAEESLEIAKSAANFIVDNLYVKNHGKAYFKYLADDEPGSHVYNASTHGVALLCNISKYIKEGKNLEITKKVMDYVISKQKSNGAWYYSEVNGKEKMQIDFHQGFILDDLYDFIRYIKPSDDKYMKTLLKGAEFYKNEQFLPDGRAKWRWPRVYPIDIHNQAQGIITFSKLSEIKPEYLDFAKTIAKWTIENMQDKTGYFYYQKWPFVTNKIPYMRWGQAWMMLALSILLEKCKNL